MMGLLAQTNAYIREAEQRHRQVKALEDRWRRPIALIDGLLQDLEELNLKGQKRVPLSYEARLREIVGLVPPVPELADAIANLKVKIGIGKLMDALFAVEEAVFSQRYGSPFDPEGSDLSSDHFTAA
jgi:hypothetical protein